MKKKNKFDENIKDPGFSSLIFKPSKVSWAINSFIIKSSAKNDRIFLYSILSFIALFLLYSSFAKKAIVVSAEGVIVSEKPALPVRSFDGFIVKKVFVKDNENVKLGQILLSGVDEDYSLKAAELKSSLNKVTEFLAHEANGKCSSLDCLRGLEQTLLMQRVSEYRGYVEGNLAEQLAGLERSFKEYSSQLESYIQLPETTSNLASSIDKVSQRVREIERLKAVKILAFEYEELKTQFADLSSQLTEKRRSTLKDLTEVRTALELEIGRLPDSILKDVDRKHVISPIAGTVRFVELKGQGQLISAGQVLFDIIHGDDKLICKLAITNTDISKIKRGQTIKLDVDAFPSSEYGVQEAKITALPVKVADATTTTLVSNYEALASLNNQKILKNGQSYEYKVGMKFKAKIITKHERLLIYVLKLLLSVKNDFLGD
jgi:multidrug efflux pump subunit AcrA (membrane-fusion protein)